MKKYQYYLALILYSIVAVVMNIGTVLSALPIITGSPSDYALIIKIGAVLVLAIFFGVTVMAGYHVWNIKKDYLVDKGGRNGLSS